MDLGVFVVKPGRYHHFVFVRWKRPWVVVVWFGPKAYIMIQLQKLTLTSLSWSLSDEFSLYEFSYPKPFPYLLGHQASNSPDWKWIMTVLRIRTYLTNVQKCTKRIRLKSNMGLQNARRPTLGDGNNFALSIFFEKLRKSEYFEISPIRHY